MPKCIHNKYMELLSAVERKFPGESRHETALRYIREREMRPISASQAVDSKAKVVTKDLVIESIND